MILFCPLTPDSAAQCANTDGLFFSQGPIPAMVQGHSHGGKFGSLVETLVTAFGPTLRFMGTIRFRPFPEGFVRRRHLPWGVAGHLGWQPEPFPQLLVHQRLQLHALRHLPIGKGDGGGMVQRVTVSQRSAPDHFCLLLGQQQFQLARQRLSGWQFIHVHNHTSLPYRCEATPLRGGAIPPRPERRGFPRKVVEWAQHKVGGGAAIARTPKNREAFLKRPPAKRKGRWPGRVICLSGVILTNNAMMDTMAHMLIHALANRAFGLSGDVCRTSTGCTETRPAVSGQRSR